MKTQDTSLQRDYDKIDEYANDDAFTRSYNIMVEDLNKRMKEFPLKDLNGVIVDSTIAAGATVRVSHSLEIVPKYRLILAQTGNGVIVDVKGKDSDDIERWNSNYITLKNEGAVEVTITMMIIRE